MRNRDEWGVTCVGMWSMWGGTGRCACLPSLCLSGLLYSRHLNYWILKTAGIVIERAAEVTNKHGGGYLKIQTTKEREKERPSRVVCAFILVECVCVSRWISYFIWILWSQPKGEGADTDAGQRHETVGEREKLIHFHRIDIILCIFYWLSFNSWKR